MNTRLGRMQELGTDFWNDSCSTHELAEAIQRGANGATSNPVIVNTVVRAEQKNLFPVLDGLIRANRAETEDEIAWRLIGNLGASAARALAPVHEKTAGARGYLSVQINPKLYRDSERMVEHGRQLALLAPNIAIKVPCTKAGLPALERLTAHGIRVNATVCFTLPQALGAAEAVERGLKTARSRGLDVSRLQPNITLMVGRLDDHLKTVMARESVTIDPGHLNWAGIAVFKKAYGIFERRGFSSQLLVAAYRHHLHWSELVGPRVAQTIPYSWWKQFEASDIELGETVSEPIDSRIVDALRRRFRDFERAYSEDGLQLDEFDGYGATVHTLNQFITGYQDLLGLVRERMLGAR